MDDVVIPKHAKDEWLMKQTMLYTQFLQRNLVDAGDSFTLCSNLLVPGESNIDIDQVPVVRVPVKIPQRFRGMTLDQLAEEMKEHLGGETLDFGLEMVDKQKELLSKATCCHGKYVAPVRLWLARRLNQENDHG